MTKIHIEVADRTIVEKVGREVTIFKREVAALRRDVADNAEIVFAIHAPHGRTGRLFRGIKSRPVGNAVVVEAHARDPESGYDYVGVTRFGHRVLKIYPGRVARSIESSVRITSHGAIRQRQTFVSRGMFALKTPWGPRAWVRGFKPTQDWAETAQIDVQAMADHKMEEFAQNLLHRLD